MFFGYGDNRTGMVLDQVRDARIQKRINEGQTNFNLPYLPQNFNIQNQVTLDPKRGEEGLRVYYETYNKDDLQGGGSVADTQSSDRMMTRKQIDAEMAKIPFMLIIGEKEVKDGLVSVRKRGEGDLGAMSIDKFQALVEDAVNKELSQEI